MKYFLCIGLQKAGTTWLASALSSQNGIGVIRCKEAHYFDRDTIYPSTNRFSEARVLKRYIRLKYLFEACRVCAKQLIKLNIDSFLWYVKYYFSDVSDTWYLSMFPTNVKIAGDCTPSYCLLDIKDINHHKNLLNSPKIILCLRNPIDRAWSHYKFDHPLRAKIASRFPHLYRNHFTRFIHSEKQRARNDIKSILHRYTEAYRGSILVVFYEAISRNPKRLLREVVEYLNDGIEELNESQLYKVYNRGKSIRIPTTYYNYLRNMYQEDITWLGNTVGSYARIWQQELDPNHERIDQSSTDIQNTVML